MISKGMRKFLAVTLVAFFPLMAGASADQTTTAAASATVSTTFSIAVDVATIPFGTVAPGSTTFLAGRNIVTCTSNDSGVDWFLKIKESAVPAGAVLAYQTSGPGNGTYVASYTDVTTANPSGSAAYASSAESNNLPTGTATTFDYRLIVANTAAAGARAWTVTYTLTQTL